MLQGFDSPPQQPHDCLCRFPCMHQSHRSLSGPAPAQLQNDRFLTKPGSRRTLTMAAVRCSQRCETNLINNLPSLAAVYELSGSCPSRQRQRNTNYLCYIKHTCVLYTMQAASLARRRCVLLLCLHQQPALYACTCCFAAVCSFAVLQQCHLGWQQLHQ